MEWARENTIYLFSRGPSAVSSESEGRKDFHTRLTRDSAKDHSGEIRKEGVWDDRGCVQFDTLCRYIYLKNRRFQRRSNYQKRREV
jgi:hypothetical protein